jgi:RNA polymerase sigma-70 factor (ECF subfamily)
MKLADKKTAVENKDFTGIYSAFYSEILNYVTYKMNNRMVAEDITSEVFVKVYKNLNTYDNSKAQFNTWLYFIANNSIIDYWRKNNNDSKNVSISNFVNDEGKETIQIEAENDSASDIEGKELMNSISKAFEGLKPKYQKVATLLFLEQKKYDEIAEICDIPMGNVKVMINRCRAMLQSQLQNQKVEYSIG